MGCCAAEGHSVFIPSPPPPPPPHPNFSGMSRFLPYPQALVIQKVKSAIHWIIQLVSLILFCWTVICLVDRATHITFKGWRMVKSETRRDAEIPVRNPSPRLFGEKFRDSKKVILQTMQKRDFETYRSKTLPRFRDPAKIFRDPRFSRHHLPPLL